MDIPTGTNMEATVRRIVTLAMHLMLILMLSNLTLLMVMLIQGIVLLLIQEAITIKVLMQIRLQTLHIQRMLVTFHMINTLMEDMADMVTAITEEVSVE